MWQSGRFSGGQRSCTGISEVPMDWTPLPLRIVLGSALAYHGFPKLFSAEGHASFEEIMKSSGVPRPELMAWAIGWLEFGGGLFLFGGLRVRWTALAIFIELAINMALATLRGGFAPPQPGQQPLPGYEYSLLYM